MAPAPNTVSVADIIEMMDRWAPPWTAESWDRVGLMVGDPAARARRVWTALELTGELVEDALDQGIDMVLVHHPPLFKPLSALRTDSPATARLIKAASRGLAVFAAHTNLDAAPGGVNDALAERLGLSGTRPLEAAGGGTLRKLVVFVPPEHAEAVSRALFAAGAGRLGDYSECSFASQGIGSFLAPPHGDPFVGRPGGRESVDELRLETVLPAAAASACLRALVAAHPYEEPAFDLYPLEQPPTGCGLGRVGDLPRPLGGGEFLARAARALGSPLGAWCGVLPERLERVAVLGGSGGDYLPQAKAAGAQMLITGEASYHAAETAADLGMCLVTLGHYHTEVVVVEPWAEKLAELAAARRLSLEVSPWVKGRSPWSAAPTEREE